MDAYEEFFDALDDAVRLGTRPQSEVYALALGFLAGRADPADLQAAADAALKDAGAGQ